jgi:SAM-dependent methyltransferase
MQADAVVKFWTEYRSKQIIRDIHPKDHMFNSAVRGWTDYEGVGVSAMQIICSAFMAGPAHIPKRVLDFGCGHGRVARHLRAALPDAEMYFSDIDETCSVFCAETFEGQYVQSFNDFQRLDLPENLDLIWVGSVFTHLDYLRMNTLFNALVGGLAPRGTLVATFRGNFLYQIAKQEKDPNQQRKWKPLLDQYEAGGIAYQAYERDKDPDWGLSLSASDRVIGLGRRFDDLLLVNYSEKGWAAVHDVAAWTKNPV